jgi:hypothetical protein
VASDSTPEEARVLRPVLRKISDQRQEQQADDSAKTRRVGFSIGAGVAQDFRHREDHLLAGPQAEEVGRDVPGGDGNEEAGDQDQADVRLKERRRLRRGPGAAAGRCA